MTHASLVERAVRWLRQYGCGIILSEQSGGGDEIPDVIGWKGKCRSVVVECKVTRADFLADGNKPFRLRPERGMGCERYYLAPAGLIRPEELPPGWGLLEVSARKVRMVTRCNPRSSLRGKQGLMQELNLMLASLVRVQVRLEPQTLTDFLKWENRMARYNGGQPPEGLAGAEAKLTDLRF